MPYRARIAIAILLLATPTGVKAACGSGTVMSYYAGTGASADDYNSAAVGYNAHADCESSVAVGTNATANGGIADIAIGHNAAASGQYSTAVGNGATASAMGAAAYGASATATGVSGTAMGAGARATGDYSSAIGQGATASAEYSTAIGYIASADHQHAVAIGYGATTQHDNQVMLGTADYTYTLAGIASASSSAAQTGSSRYMVTTDENGNLAVAAVPSGSSIAVVNDLSSGGGTDALSAEQGKVLDGRVAAAQGTADAAQLSAWSATVTANTALVTSSGALQRSGGVMTGKMSMGGHRVTDVGAPLEAGDAVNKAYVDGKVDALSNRVANVERQARINTEGVAVAIAMGGVSLPANKNIAVGANLGFFQDAQAFAAQGVFRVDEHIYFNSGIGMAIGNASTTGGRVGLMAAW